MSGLGKTCECIAITAAMLSERISAITVYYNGQSITFGPGWGFDTQPFDDSICAINVGTVLGALLTVKNAIYECATDNPSAATALTGASFTDVNDANDESVRRGAVQCKDTLRYLFLRTEVVAPSTTVPTVDFGAIWIGGSAREQATSQPLSFDV
jgi:hypothetical protein